MTALHRPRRAHGAFNRLTAALTGVMVLAHAPQAHAISNNVRPDFYSTNGIVLASVQKGDTLYIGGTFTEVGPASGGGIPVNAATGVVPPVFPQVGGAVRVVIPDGSGGWYIGGSFNTVGGQLRNRLAHLLSDGSVSPWNPNPNSEVQALALAGGTLYVGGLFTTFDGQLRNYLAAIDLATGAVLPWDPNLSNPVMALTVSGNTLYVGGYFTTAGGTGRNRLASYDTNTGLLTSWNPNADPGGPVFSIVVSGGTAYVGGSFTNMGGQPRVGAAAVDATTGALLPWNPSPGTGASVQSMTLRSGLLYVGGSFSTIGGQARSNIAALNTTTGAATAWNPSANAQVTSVVAGGTAVYAGGQFGTIDGQVRRGLAALDTTNGHALSWDPPISTGFAIAVNGMALSGGTLYVGGGYSCLAPKQRLRLAAIDVRTGLATDWNPGANSNVFALVLDRGTIYAGGTFTAIGGQSRQYLAALDATTGNTTAWDPSPNSQVRALTRNSSKLYAEGFFSQIAGQTRANFASFDLATGALNAFTIPGLPNFGSFLSIAASDERFFRAMGLCTRVMNMCIWSLGMSAFDANTGANTSWTSNVTYTNSMNPLPVVLMTQGDKLLVGGENIRESGSGRNNLFALSQATGAPTSWGPSFSSSSSVTAFGLSGNTIFVAGNYTTIGGQLRRGLAALDATTAAVLTWNPSGGGGGVSTLAVTDSTVFVGGSFASFGPTAQSNLAAFGDPTPIADSYLETPLTMTLDPGAAGPPVFGRAEVPGVTSQSGSTMGLAAQFGYGPDGSDPASSSWVWFNASYDSEEGTSDRFAASFTAGGAGGYDYGFRYSFYTGPWVYADADGSGNGYSPAEAGALTVTGPLSVGSNPREMALAVLGANPAQAGVRFRMDLPAAASVRLCIHDVSGRQVATIVNGTRSGRQEITWAAGERSGMPPGVYYARMSAADRVIVRKFVLLR